MDASVISRRLGPASGVLPQAIRLAVFHGQGVYYHL